MTEVGEILKKNRLSKGLTIEEVSSELKIPYDIILKIENNLVQQNPDIVFIFGHLRVYCNYLDLETSEIIKNFKKQISYNINDVNESISKPINIEKRLNLSRYIPFFFIIFIFSSFYILFIKESENKINYALISDLPENLVPIIEMSDLESIKKNNNQNNSSDIEQINESNFTKAIASNNINDNSKVETITLKSLNPTWLQLRDNSNKIILSKLMEKDEEYSYDISLKYNITTGNAGSILVIIDDKVRGKIGKYGEVLDSFILDKNFNN